MTTSFTLVPMTQEHLEPALELFLESYRQERRANPALPRGVLDQPGFIRAALKTSLGNPGVASFQQERLAGFMLTGDRFTWKGQQAALVHEYSHSAQEGEKPELYRLMYQRLAQEWLGEGIHLHLIGHLAHDKALLDTLYLLGFGGLVCEQVRDLDRNVQHPEIPIREERDPQNLIDLELEHRRYYQQSPIFLARELRREQALAEIASQIEAGDQFHVAYEDGQSCAYMILGESNTGGEGFLLQHSNSAQIKSAYVKPAARSQGVGSALLQYAIEWSRRAGFERLFVEHETANLSGGSFWRKHFEPFVYFSMRYIDSTL
jgi:GNAT superfamily N-acetyltransferase